MHKSTLLIALAVCASLLGACAQFESKRGVEVNWQDTVTDELVIGTSTRKDVLTLLGPHHRSSRWVTKRHYITCSSTPRAKG